jgi:hypothetical protein
MLTTEKLKYIQFQFFRYYVNSIDARCTCYIATFHNMKVSFIKIIVKREKKHYKMSAQIQIEKSTMLRRQPTF